jgi:hypothetical protein
VITFTATIFSLIALYFWIVFSYLPKFMKNRDPYAVKNWLRFYNIFQIIACSVFVVMTYNLGFDYRFIWKCESFDFIGREGRIKILLGLFLFLSLRVFEFSETFVFMLRKKLNQASFLHMYHHVSTVLLMWVFIVFDTGKVENG